MNYYLITKRRSSEIRLLTGTIVTLGVTSVTKAVPIPKIFLNDFFHILFLIFIATICGKDVHNYESMK